jgi:tRNA (uracil-5-)-methyltransferase TRM9
VRYLSILGRISLINWSRSQALVEIARQHQPHSSIVADALSLPHPDSTFDFAISIAVVHHLSSNARRVEAISAVLRTLKPTTSIAAPCGQALFFVWALEQKSSRRAWDTGDEQDVLVPWVLKPSHTKTDDDRKERTFQRYYHLYQQGELERDIIAAGGTISRSGYDRDNWWAIAFRV